MKLGIAQLEWNDRVTRKAQSRGWQVYDQITANKRTADPSLILTKNDRVLLVWLRTGRRRADAQPPVERFPEGIETAVWYPSDWPFVLSALERPRDAA
ncbi:hypothetical protein [Streptomyces candidus]|uniref:Uncharacterized protein n=1 Tax=Streptomyces candidus TaxID=67283 RepID=A0A7X0LR77_9ACTN|nr:hypothetical protein [Streptomyces candidus]MBB6437204.1 hypothetical protein [Streptomyces candidus]GHH38205.1 hypothetical protein GCM10018773_15810 [Streptomyces candidus]